MSRPVTTARLTWREKLPHGRQRGPAARPLGHARRRVSLPFVLLYAFAPKPDTASLVGALIPALLLARGLVGVRALVQMKTWGVLALGAAGGMLLAYGDLHHLALVSDDGRGAADVGSYPADRRRRDAVRGDRAVIARA